MSVLWQQRLCRKRNLYLVAFNEYSLNKRICNTQMTVCFQTPSAWPCTMWASTAWCACELPVWHRRDAGTLLLISCCLSIQSYRILRLQQEGSICACMEDAMAKSRYESLSSSRASLPLTLSPHHTCAHASCRRSCIFYMQDGMRDGHACSINWWALVHR